MESAFRNTNRFLVLAFQLRFVAALAERLAVFVLVRASLTLYTDRSVAHVVRVSSRRAGSAVNRSNGLTRITDGAATTWFPRSSSIFSSRAVLASCRAEIGSELTNWTQHASIAGRGVLEFQRLAWDALRHSRGILEESRRTF